MTINIELLGAEKLQAKMDLLGRPHPAIVSAMNDIADKLVSTVQANKLSGQVLKVQTGRLRRSITRQVESTADGINAIAGTNVEYAKIHEYGGTITIPPRQMLIRHRLTAKGELMRQSSNQNLLRFAKKSHKLAREMTVKTQGHTVTMPERSFMRTSLQETKAYAKARLLQALNEATQ